MDTKKRRKENKNTGKRGGGEGTTREYHRFLNKVLCKIRNTKHDNRRWIFILLKNLKDLLGRGKGPPLKVDLQPAKWGRSRMSHMLASIIQVAICIFMIAVWEMQWLKSGRFKSRTDSRVFILQPEALFLSTNSCLSHCSFFSHLPQLSLLNVILLATLSYALSERLWHRLHKVHI